MRRIASLSLAATLAVIAAGATAAEDPVLTRQKLMSAAGAAVYGAANRMMKGEMEFNPVVAASAIRTANAVAYSAGDYFPEGSDAGDTKASPRIWEDMAGFQEDFADLQQKTEAALNADPKDLDSFKAAMTPVIESCGACHDDFRLKDN